jgi:hypothetical protein
VQERARGGEGADSGFALLIAIAFLLTATAVIAPFVLAARTALDTAAATLRSDRLEFVAEGLATVVAHALSALPPDELSGFVPGVRSEPVACRSDGLTIETRVQDQRGLIDLNIADEALLELGLRAVGLDRSLAAAHARAMVAYRSTDAAEGAPLPGGDEAVVRDGPKKAPFEAVEELYDFEALSAVPLDALRQTFTVHTRQPQVVGPLMPDALAEVLPRLPAPGFPFVAGDAGGGGTFRIEVFVRAADASLGYAGLVASAGSLEVPETSVSPPSPIVGSVRPRVTSCDAVFGPAAAALREISA